MSPEFLSSLLLRFSCYLPGQGNGEEGRKYLPPLESDPFRTLKVPGPDTGQFNTRTNKETLGATPLPPSAMLVSI